MKIREFVREYRVELIAGSLALLGIFLLVERMEIRVTMLRLASWAWRTLTGAIGAVFNAVFYRISHITTSDLLGLALIVLAVAVTLWRVRVRLTQRFAEHVCPICGANLRRLHRRWSDRLLSLLVPVGRYRCRNEECGWEGRRAKNN